MKAYTPHHTNKAKNQIVNYLILEGEVWLTNFFCVDGLYRTYGGAITGCDIVRYKSINNI